MGKSLARLCATRQVCLLQLEEGACGVCRSQPDARTKLRPVPGTPQAAYYPGPYDRGSKPDELPCDALGVRLRAGVLYLLKAETLYLDVTVDFVVEGCVEGRLRFDGGGRGGSRSVAGVDVS